MKNNSINFNVAVKTIGTYVNWELNNNEINVLLYFIQMFHLGKYNQRIIDANFEIYPEGPRINKLHHKLKIFENKKITDIFGLYEENQNKEQNEFIKEFVNLYESYNAFKLSLLLKRDNTAVSITRAVHATIIKDAAMITEYKIYYDKNSTLNDNIKENLNSIEELSKRIFSENYNNSILSSIESYKKDNFINAIVFCMVIAMIVNNNETIESFYNKISLFEAINYNQFFSAFVMTIMLCWGVLPIKRFLYVNINKALNLIFKIKRA